MYYIKLKFKRNEINEAEWKFLLTGGLSFENSQENPCPEWLSEKSWSEIINYSEFKNSLYLMEHIKQFVSSYKKMINIF